MFRAARRVPFTVLFEIAIVAVAFWDGSAWGRLSDELRAAWGFGPLTFWQEHWHTLMTNAFLVRNALMLTGMVVLIAASVGVYEWRAGTRRALFVFWSANAATLLLLAAFVVWPMRIAGVPPRWDWAPTGDVGASFGGFGCVGAWVVRVRSARARYLLFAGLIVWLALKYILAPELFGDAGHFIALGVGVVLGRTAYGRGSSAVEPPRPM